MVVIGIDPDSKAHGVAVYKNGKLDKLECMPLMQLYLFIDNALECESKVIVHIENVKGNNASFKGRQPVNVQKDIGRRIGMVQQSQTEIERMLEHLGVDYKLHKISKLWKKDKNQFEKVTGWKGRSNEDTRSAAYFGFLGLKTRANPL